MASEEKKMMAKGWDPWSYKYHRERIERFWQKDIQKGLDEYFDNQE